MVSEAANQVHPLGLRRGSFPGARHASGSREHLKIPRANANRVDDPDVWQVRAGNRREDPVIGLDRQTPRILSAREAVNVTLSSA
jgi:hypothetical protein